MYLVHSFNTPEVQDYNLNYCLSSSVSKAVLLVEGCQYFIVHSPGINRDPRTISFESVCFPGHYLVQSQGAIYLEEKVEGQDFGKEYLLSAFYSGHEALKSRIRITFVFCVSKCPGHALY